MGVGIVNLSKRCTAVCRGLLCPQSAMVGQGYMDRTLLPGRGGGRRGCQSAAPTAVGERLPASPTPALGALCRELAENPDTAWTMTLYQLRRVVVPGDGSCQFASFGLQVGEDAGACRAAAVAWIRDHEEQFQPFLDIPAQVYTARMEGSEWSTCSRIALTQNSIYIHRDSFLSLLSSCCTTTETEVFQRSRTMTAPLSNGRSPQSCAVPASRRSRAMANDTWASQA